ncbi:MAG TPA: transposase [Sandaracinaceae bacterium LLY-WYZ-13_1]|nr:transposase [Sandaracinaceae bacterium LLY-WYZ-13_1]
MPRTNRSAVTGWPHHVVLRGNNRRRLFSYASDYLRLLAYLVKALERVPCQVHALVLMANHMHLLLTPLADEALSRFVKAFAQRYAQYRNRTRGGSGKLFEQRFYAQPIENDAHFGCTLAYIELNPPRAGRVAAPSEYRYSTYHLHADDGVAKWAATLDGIWTPSSWYLDLSDDPARRRTHYTRWVRDCRERDRRPDHHADLERLEAVSRGPRLRRPDGSSAR